MRLLLFIKIFILAGVSFTVSLYPCFAVSYEYHFRHYASEDGFSQDAVFSVLQDSKGFLWVGTDSSLSRFDGFDFRTFVEKPDATDSLSDNHVRCMIEDRDGFLWIGTNSGGLNRYSSETGSFDHFTWSSRNLGQNRVLVIHQGEDGQIWVGGIGGLSLLNREKGLLENMADPVFRSIDRLRAIYEIGDGRFLLGGDNGLVLFDPSRRTFDPIAIEGPDSEEHHRIYAIHRDRDGVLWVGGNNGLAWLGPDYQLGPETRFQPVTGEPGQSRILKIMEDRQGLLWLATTAGLQRYDKKTQITNKFQQGGQVRPDFGIHQTVYDILEDEVGNIWVGTSSGLYSYNPTVESFNHISPQEQLGAPTNNTASLYMSDLNTLWVGTSNGLLRVRRDTNETHLFQAEEGNPHALSNGHIWCMTTDREGSLWLGTQIGLNRLPAGSDHFEHRFIVPNQLRHLGNTIMAILPNEDGSFWAGTGDGLYQYHPEKGILQTLRNQPDRPDSISLNLIFSLLRDGPGLWVGTVGGGLEYLDLDSGKFHHFLASGLKGRGIAGTNIWCLLKSRQGMLWVATNDGLYCLIDRDLGTFKSYTIADGLVSNSIAAILEDEKGQIWLSTNMGISILDPVKRTVFNLDRRDGLQGNLFNQGSVFQAGDGEFLFGGSNGFNAFYPRDVAPSDYNPQIRITRFRINNQDMETSRTNPDSPFVKTVDETESIQLKPSQRVFYLEFASLDFTRPARNRLAYKLEGFDQTWIESDSNRRFAAYTNLDPGSYSFRVKGTNKDGVWASNEARLNIKVLPAIYLTWWARLIYLVIAASLIFGYIRIQEEKLARERKLAEMDRQIAEQERQTAARLRQVDRLKDEFLANTSHELRTPLNGIIGLAESLMAGATGRLPQQTVKNLSMIVTSGRRLASLVNDILDFSKLKNQNLALQRRPVDMGMVTDVVFALSEPLIGKKKLRLVNDLGEDLPAVEGDEGRLKQIMHNLIGNAVKFTEAGFIRVSGVVRGNQLLVSVQDTGPGIPETKLDAIFHSFEQLDGTEVRGFGGTGLGLAITRQLIELHDGKIQVSSKLGEGSVFTFNLPISAKEAESREPKSAIQIEERSVLDEPGLGAETSQQADGTGPLILVVDDEPINRQVLLNHLFISGYRAIEAQSGAEALALIKVESEVALVIVDIMMPGMSGYEVCRRLRTRFSAQDLPILFLTARDQDQDLALAFESGGNDYLTKPVSKTELISRVENHLAMRDTHRNLETRVAERTHELTRKNDELVRTRNQLVLQEKMTSLGTLTAGIAHEILNPLNFVNNFADTAIGLVEDLDQSLELVLKGRSSQEVRELIGELTVNASQIATHGRRAEQIVKNMLEFSREGGDSFQEVYLNELVEQYAPLPVMGLAPADRDKLKMEFSLDPAAGKVSMDQRNMTRVLVNLVRNSVESILARAAGEPSEYSGLIRVSTATRGDQVAIRVQDNGEGIAPQNLNAIFNPFFTTRHDNIGLGLSISFDIVVQEHHGSFSVDARQGEYAAVTILLPRENH